MPQKITPAIKTPFALKRRHGFAPTFKLISALAMLSLVGCGGGSSGGTNNGTSSVNNSGNNSVSTITVADKALAPAITVQPADITVAELQAASFSVSATGTAPLSFEWRRNGTLIAGATSATLTIASALAADHNAKYSAVVTNSAGSATSTEAVLTEELPMFLMAGQSNMEGNVDTTLFQALLADLASAATTDIKARLVERIRYWHKDTNNGYAGYGYSDQMAAFEATELVRLNAAGLVGANLTTPNTKVLCAMNTAIVTPLAANCGNPYGPELVFGQTLGKAGYSATSMIKVARGGTNLYADWRSPLSVLTSGALGPDYTKLRARIQSLKLDPAGVNPSCKARACRWSAFVWFQGEADSDSLQGDAYEQNLKNLIADVRSEAGSPTLPVVIVQTGAWAQSLKRGKNVAATQTAVVAADPYARMVTTSDLSGFYHYDSAAQLIIGERVGLAVQSLLAAAPASK